MLTPAKIPWKHFFSLIDDVDVHITSLLTSENVALYLDKGPSLFLMKKNLYIKIQLLFKYMFFILQKTLS